MNQKNAIKIEINQLNIRKDELSLIILYLICFIVSLLVFIFGKKDFWIAFGASMMGSQFLVRIIRFNRKRKS